MKPELTVLPFTVAETFSEIAELTREVVILNVFEVLPAGMVTVDGSWAVGSLDVNATTTPPVGAGLVRFTVPVLPTPPVTELGDEEMAWIATEEPIPKPQLTVVELYVAEMVTFSVATTLDVVIGNVTELFPARTITLDGTWASVLLEESETVIPPLGAVPLR